MWGTRATGRRAGSVGTSGRWHVCELTGVRNYRTSSRSWKGRVGMQIVAELLNTQIYRKSGSLGHVRGDVVVVKGVCSCAYAGHDAEQHSNESSRSIPATSWSKRIDSAHKSRKRDRRIELSLVCHAAEEEQATVEDETIDRAKGNVGSESSLNDRERSQSSSWIDGIIEETRSVDWPAPGQAFQTTLVVFVVTAGAAFVLFTLNTALISVSESLFTK